MKEEVAALASSNHDRDFLLAIPEEYRASYASHWGWIDEYLERTPKSRVELFIEEHCSHTKGKWMGEPFQLLPWQRYVCREVFETKDPETGLRLYSTAYVTVPRKDGKTEFAACVVLYMTVADEENGSEVYGAAHDRKQAGTLYKMARKMVEQDPSLSAAFDVYTNSLIWDSEVRGECYYQPISSEAGGAHSTSPHCVVCDEVHTWTGQKGKDLFEALTTGQGSREQPLTLIITTRGNDTDGICFDLDAYSDKVERGIVVDPSWFSFRAFATKEDDWKSPDTWVKANPSIGRTVRWAYLEDRYRKTEGNPSARAAFRTFNLNTWGEGTARWIDQDKWTACGEDYTLEDLAGRECYGGLDLSSTTDLTAFALVFKPTSSDLFWRLLCWFWVPEGNLEEKIKLDSVPYDQWREDGFLVATEGDIVDHAKVCADIQAIGDLVDIQEIAFDRWGSVQVSTHLQDAGFDMLQFGQGFKDMSPPTKSLGDKIATGEVHHNNQPVLSWCADNTVVRIDEAENHKPDKKRSAGRIDGIVAAIMALSTAELAEETPILTASPVTFLS